ncbi:hypothetical protein NP493_265g00047 [Ridgeia piscesae]|uniref:CUB domain-containing protein n=1 Tax=Ridgeia piscesae TaxID=27915 RepID=A0AAD9NXX0_RIDPI|nr:hypothetical protein NP493_265g00047 [Ridgeia piscesae]
MTCGWMIHVPSYEVKTLITLKFRKIDTEMHYDVISVFDGPNKSAHNLGNFSGQTLPTDVTTTTGYLYVDFKSDLRTTKMGFSLTYTATDSFCKINYIHVFSKDVLCQVSFDCICICICGSLQYVRFNPGELQQVRSGDT